MLTYKLKIKHTAISPLPPEGGTIKAYCKKYSFLFRKLYANFELSADKNFQRELQEKYSLDSWFYESCRIEVEMKLNQQKTQKEKQVKQIQSIDNELINTKFEGKKGKRRKFYLLQKLAFLRSRKDKAISFGGLSLLRKISFLSNNKVKNAEEIRVLKTKYQAHRILPVYSIGEAPQKSNRKFLFNLLHQEITFKPNKNTKFCVNFYCSKQQ